jgi:hypothetical protein
MKKKLIAVVVVALAHASQIARAQAPGTVAMDVVETEVVEERYGWQIAAVDGASVALAIAMAAAEYDDVAGQVFIGTWSLGAPAVHVAHGNPGRAVVSLGLHVGLPRAGAAIGAASATCTEGEWFCGLGEAAVGFLLGGITATAVDAGLLAVERRTIERPRRGFQAAPTASAGNGSYSLGLIGRF